MFFADFNTGAGKIVGTLTFFFGIVNNGAFCFGDIEFVHEELDAFWDFGADDAFFEVGESAIITTDDFVFGGTTDGFVVGDAFADDVDTHVGGGIINSFAGDAGEDFFENREGFEVAVVIDGSDAVFF